MPSLVSHGKCLRTGLWGEVQRAVKAVGFIRGGALVHIPGRIPGCDFGLLQLSGSRGGIFEEAGYGKLGF